jgi:hypothetical protein
MVISLFLLLFSTTANAQDFQNVKQGETVPFDGTLLTPDAIATVISKQDSELMLCQENNKHEIEKLVINKDTEIKNLEFELQTCKDNKIEIIQEKDKEIDRLYGLVQKKQPNHIPLWISIGFVGGLATSLGTYYVYNNL